MMDALRTHATGWVAKILIGLLALSFAIWGIADVFRPRANDVLATVGSQEIRGPEFERQFEREVRNFGERSGTPLTREQARSIGLDREVLNVMLNSAALANQADRMDLKLSAKYIVEQLADNPQFKDKSGNFSPERFRQIIAQSGMSEGEIVNSERKGAIANGIITAVAADPVVPDTLAEIAWTHRNEQRDVRYFVLPADTVKVPEPTDAELKTFYEANQPQFTVPDRRIAQLLIVTPATVAPTITVSEDELKQAYEKTKDTLGVPEVRHILQIPFPNVDEAKKARDAIAGGKSFEDVAKERGLKDTDMTLGDLSKAKVLDKAVGEAAFALPLNEVSQPVQGKLSTFLLKVTNIQPATTMTLDQARQQLTDQLRVEKAKDVIFDLHGKIEDARAGGSTFEEIAKNLNLPLRTVGPITREGRDDKGLDVKDIPEQSAVLKAVFESDTGVDNDAISTPDDGFIWFDVREVIPSSIKPFDQVKQQVIDGWKAQKRREGVLDAARALQKRLVEGAKLDDLAKEAGREIKTQTGLKRTETNADFDSAAVASLFAAPPTGFAIALEPDGAGAKIMQSAPVMQPPFDPKSQEAQAIGRVLGQRLTSDLSLQYLEGLKKDYGVKLNEELWQRLAGGQR
ncbi:MAG: SurA N-terminal domain-containing protein [Hyphomicrobiales bacterium]